MKKKFSINYLTPDSRVITFASGEEVLVKHVFELKDYLVIGGDDCLFVVKKDRLLVLMSIKLKGKCFDEEYDKKENVITFHYHGASYSATLDLDTMTFDEKHKEDVEKRVEVAKNTEDSFFCVFEDASKKSFYVQIGTSGNVFPYFLRVNDYIIFGNGKIFTIRNLKTKEKCSLAAGENALITEVKLGKENTGTVVFVAKRGNDCVFDLISKKVVSGEKLVVTL